MEITSFRAMVLCAVALWVVGFGIFFTNNIENRRERVIAQYEMNLEACRKAGGVPLTTGANFNWPKVYDCKFKTE